MPTRYLSNADDFNSLDTWLKANLSIENSIKACSDLLNKVPKEKGIYFWFMKKDAYKELSNFVSINPIDKRITWEINKQEYDLVYIGKTGDRGKGTGQFNQRLTSHIKEHPNNDRLSTFRVSISALLSKQLWGDCTEKLINDFLCKNMIVYWVVFDQDKINSNEKLLIRILRPLLNSDDNPNKEIKDNPTNVFSVRRNEVKKNSVVTSNITNTKNVIKSSIKMTPKSITLPNNDRCKNFFVLQNESIHEVAKAKQQDLPKGPCSIEILDSKTNKPLYVKSNGESKRKTKLNVWEFFANPDPSKGKYKWELVKEEMEQFKIEKIRVIVCPDEENSQETVIFPEPEPVMIGGNKNPVQEQTKNLIKKLDVGVLKDNNIPKLLIIGCSDRKTTGGFVPKAKDYFTGAIGYGELVAQRGIVTGANLATIKGGLFKEAIDRYDGPFYNLYNLRAKYRANILSSGLHVLIISGLYGLLKHDDHIVEYDLKLTKLNWGNTTILNAIKEYIIQNGISDNNVYHSLNYAYRGITGINAVDAWNNLWINHGRGHKSAEFLANHFLR